LEEAGYIEVEKTFFKRKPKTVCRPTSKGKQAYAAYVKALEQMIHWREENGNDD
jgi:DNA-binding PadR family transcriptional regulator